MDEGQYNGKVDVWSLGITSIELGQSKTHFRQHYLFVFNIDKTLVIKDRNNRCSNNNNDQISTPVKAGF